MNVGKNQFLFARCDEVPPTVVCEKKLPIGEFLFFLGKNSRYTRACKKGRELVVLGYCVNADVPTQTCQQMCDWLLDTLDESCENVAELTQNWGGRWVAFARINGCWHIWNDACGLKQCFCYDERGSLIVASQARYICELHNLQEDPNAVEYMHVTMKAYREYAWPVDATMYEQVVRLLPNHIWRQGNGRPMRMKNILMPLKSKEPEKRAMELLCNAMRGAAAHSKLAVTLTAGWDSRLVLAACEGVKEHCRLVTLRYADMPENHPDVVVAQKLANCLDLDHRVLLCAEENSEFTKAYRKHSENAHTYWIQMAQQTYLRGYEKDLWVKGACNEILRNPNGILYNWQITPKLLCKLFQLPQTAFSLAAVTRWLKDARPYCNQYHYRLLDLFYWEHRMGSWLAECLNEADVASDMFTPFNIRSYLSVGYQIPWKQRIAPNYAYFMRLLKLGDSNIMQVPLRGVQCHTAMAWVKWLVKNRLPLAYGIILLLRP